MIEIHIKETLTLNQWNQEDFEAEITKRQIIYEWGIFKLPVNNSRLQTSIKPPRSSQTWQFLMEGSFKMNFDGAAKGNPGPVGFIGVIRNSEGKVLSVFWGSIGTNANNLVKLEGLINGLAWSLK